MSRGITERQRSVLRFIQDFIAKERFPPTLREIGNNFGMKSTNGVNDHLVALEKKGYIRRRSDISRGIEILHPEHEGAAINPTHNLPVVTKLTDKDHILTMKNIAEYYTLDMTMWNTRPDFGVVLKHDVPAHGLKTGDVCAFRLDSENADNDVVAAIENDEVTVHLFQDTRSKTGDNFKVIGKMVGFIRRY